MKKIRRNRMLYAMIGGCIILWTTFFYFSMGVESETKVETVVNQQEEQANKPPEKANDKPMIAFTFDDGPHPYLTDRLLDALIKNDAKATFFVLGNNAEKYPDTIKRAHQEGMELGNHTYDHQDLVTLGKDAIRNEIDKTQEIVNSISDFTMTSFRPPYGSVNETVSNTIDMDYIYWDIDTRDWESRDKDAIMKIVKEQVKENSVILFHDLYEPTIEAVEALLPELSKEYQFVTVNTLMKHMGLM